MAVYRPTYKDLKTGETKTSTIWWYDFRFAGRRIQESSKSARKTIAVEAEKKRRRELEKGFNAIVDTRAERVRTVDAIADSFLENHRLRSPRSIRYYRWALSHVKRLYGKLMSVDVSEDTISAFQTTRLKEGAAHSSVNHEVIAFLRLLGEQGDLLRLALRRKKTLKLKARARIAKAFSDEEKADLLEAAKTESSPAILPALMLALHAGMRDKEIRTLQWSRVDLARGIVTVGASKTEAGEGRTIPLNGDVQAALVAHSRWYLDKFGETRPEWFLFPFGRPRPSDPTKPLTTFKSSWNRVKKVAGVKGRWHDNRHTFITDLAESGEASDETIRDMAGHVSKEMLQHYSHIRMEAKRRAVDSLVRKPTNPKPAEVPKEITKVKTLH